MIGVMRNDFVILKYYKYLLLWKIWGFDDRIDSYDYGVIFNVEFLLIGDFFVVVCERYSLFVFDFFC